MRIMSSIVLGCLSGAEFVAPAASRLGERLARFARWVEERRIRLAIFATIAD